MRPRRYAATAPQDTLVIHEFSVVLAQSTVDVPFDFVPIDISEGALIGLMRRLEQHFPSVSASGIVSDYFQGLAWLGQKKDKLSLVLFLGSNIGNFHAEACHGFLCRLWNSLSDGDLVLIGFDLKKDVRTLVRAYDDSHGLTREFNLNLLRRINNELGGTFDLNAFEHYAVYNPTLGAMESYVISKREQHVLIEALQRTFFFDAAEAIHMEYSHKYSIKDVHRLAADNGFEVIADFYDDNKHFADSIWRVRK